MLTLDMALVIRRSQIHADGVYTTTPIKRRTTIAEYTGPRLVHAAADAIYEHSPRTYLFGLEDGVRVVDGDGIAAFINHSCDPNCESDVIDEKVVIRALRNIDAGEELSYDYCLYDGDPDDLALCHCTAKNCRGSMYSEEEIEKRNKSKRKSASKTRR